MNEYVDLTYYQKNRDMILNGAKGYYENDKERLRGQARDKYKSLSEEEKNKKREYGKIDISICLKKRKKNKRQKRQKNHNLIMNKIVF